MGEHIDVTSADLCRLLALSRQALSKLDKRGIIHRASRGRWNFEASVAGYVKHLRAEAAGRGGEAGADVRAKLASAQADLAAEKVKARGCSRRSAGSWASQTPGKGRRAFTRHNRAVVGGM
jgi:phage terminase Nu1 subunit (DNA packaging protein)